LYFTQSTKDPVVRRGGVWPPFFLYFRVSFPPVCGCIARGFIV